MTQIRDNRDYIMVSGRSPKLKISAAVSWEAITKSSALGRQAQGQAPRNRGPDRAGYFKSGWWMPRPVTHPKPRKRADKMGEPQVKDTKTDVSIVSNDLQDVESLQTAIEVIVHEKDTRRSLAQLYPALDASPFTPSLVCPTAFTYVTVTDL